MTSIVALTVFGRELPDARFLLVIAGLALVFLVLNRNGGLAQRSSVGEGRQHQCKRCGHRFQPQRKVLEDDGDVEKFYNDRCPNCGWDLDWGKPDAFGNRQH